MFVRRLAVLACLAGAAACGAGQDPTLDVPDGQQSVPGGSTVTSAPPTTVAAPNRPERWVGIDDEGRLVVVASETGAVERVLAEADHPTECPEGEEPSAGCRWIVEVTVSPDGQSVLYETCCEPAPGVIYRVPIAGGEPTQLAFGGYPALDPAGERLAVVELQWVTVIPLTGEEARSFREDDGDVPEFLQGMSWSPDGETLAFSVFDTRYRTLRLHTLPLATAATLADARAVPQPPAESWTLAQYRSDGLLTVVDQDENVTEDAAGEPGRGLVVDPRNGSVKDEWRYDERVRSQHLDSSGTHLIVTLAGGSVLWRSPAGDTAVLAPSGYIAAAW